VNALSYQPTSPTLSDVDCGVVATFAYAILYRGMGLRWHGYETTRRRMLLAIVEERLSCVQKLLEGTSDLALASAPRCYVLQLCDVENTVHCDLHVCDMLQSAGQRLLCPLMLGIFCFDSEFSHHDGEASTLED
jgi:hypothetical protein